jgi:hypothetical protein
MSHDQVHDAYVTWHIEQVRAGTDDDGGYTLGDGDWNGCWYLYSNDGRFNVGED